MEQEVIKQIKEKLQEIWQKIQQTEVFGDELSKDVIFLSSRMGDYGAKLADLERLYINKQIKIINEKEIAVNKAELFVKSTDEYLNWKKAKELEKALIETIRAIKLRIKVLGHEKETSGDF